jgi:hypothetical protein
MIGIEYLADLLTLIMLRGDCGGIFDNDQSIGGQIRLYWTPFKFGF